MGEDQDRLYPEDDLEKERRKLLPSDSVSVGDEERMPEEVSGDELARVIKKRCRIKTTRTLSNCEMALLGLSIFALVWVAGLFGWLAAQSIQFGAEAIDPASSAPTLAATQTEAEQEHDGGEMEKSASVSASVKVRMEPLLDYDAMNSEQEDQPMGVRGFTGVLPSGSSALPISELKFKAYDCSVPYNKTAVTMAPSLACAKSTVKKQQSPKKKYLLLQKARRIPFEVKECIATYSRQAYVCGNAGHGSPAPGENFYGVPMPMSPDECDKAHRDGTFWAPHTEPNWYADKAPWDPMHKDVNKNGTTHFRWVKSGVTWAHKDNDIICEPSRFYWKGGYRNRDGRGLNHYMSVTDFVTMTLRTRTAYLTVDAEDEEDILIDHNQLVLPKSCSLESERCQVSDGPTYVWKRPKDKNMCPLYRLRETEGVDVVDEGPDKVTYMSTDNSMIRLTKMEPARSECGAVVYATDHERLYLTEDSHFKPFQRKLPPSEGSPYLYANQKLHFAYASLKQGIEEAVLTLRMELCQEEEHDRVKRYARKAAEQRAVSDGDTVHVAGDLFGTAAGEIWWVYACRPVEVLARETSGMCYDALPVTLSDKDLSRILINRKRPAAGVETTVTQEELLLARNSTQQYFMEPSSRRLITSAIGSDCLTPLSSVYRNTQGRWVKYQGDYVPGPKPTVMKDAMSNFTLHLDPYYVDGGIYSGNMIKEFEMFTDARRAERGLLHYAWLEANGKFVDQQDYGWYQSALPQLPTQEVLDGINRLAWFWKLIDSYGTICGLAVGTAILYKFATFSLGVTLRLCSNMRHPNPLVHIIGAFFPSITERLTQGRYRSTGTPGPCHDLASACCQCKSLPTPVDSEDEADRPDPAAMRKFKELKREHEMIKSLREEHMRQLDEEKRIRDIRMETERQRVVDAARRENIRLGHLRTGSVDAPGYAAISHNPM